MSRQTSSLPNGSTARSRVIRVVSSRLLPHGIVDEKANGPAATGQNVLSNVLTAGSGLGGRKFWHRYELFDHALRVSTDVDVKRVAWKLDFKKKNGTNCNQRGHTETCTGIHQTQYLLWACPKYSKIEIVAQFCILENLCVDCTDVEFLIQASLVVKTVLKRN